MLVLEPFGVALSVAAGGAADSDELGPTAAISGAGAGVLPLSEGPSGLLGAGPLAGTEGFASSNDELLGEFRALAASARRSLRVFLRAPFTGEGLVAGVVVAGGLVGGGGLVVTTVIRGDVTIGGTGSGGSDTVTGSVDAAGVSRRAMGSTSAGGSLVSGADEGALAGISGDTMTSAPFSTVGAFSGDACSLEEGRSVVVGGSDEATALTAGWEESADASVDSAESPGAA